MEVMACDVADLFNGCEVAGDETGSLIAIAGLLHGCDPVVLLLADEDGNLIVAESFGAEAGQEESTQLAARLGKGLIDRDTCLLTVPNDDGPRVAFAVRLSDRAERGIVGGVVRRDEAFEKALPDMQNAIAVCGEVAWIAIQNAFVTSDLQTRVQHLLNEQDTLRISHARAISNAIEEREERLREQQEHMARLERLHLQNRMILDSAGEGIFGLEGEGKIAFVNPAGADMLGWEPEDLVGRLEHQTFHHTKRNGQHYALEECPIRATLHEGVVGVASHEIFWRKDGTSFPVEYTSTPIREGLEIVGVVLTFRDTTERIALERQLAQAQKLESIGQLAAGVAHEINTPTQYIGDNTRFLQEALRELDTVLGSFDRLLNAAKDHTLTDDLVAEVEATVDEADLDYLAEEMPKAVEQSLEGVGRVAAIVRSMKEFSHPGSDEKQAIDINRALENTLTVCRSEWKYVADAVTEVDATLPRVNCLPGECNQVFLNLIINAAHAIGDKLGSESTEKGTITVSTCHDGDWVEIRVRDNGTGIPEDARAKVFDPFFTSKEVGRGTGQGLAIAHSVIVDKHGGSLTFETETGKGTTFVIRLPIGQKLPSPVGVEDAEANTVR